MSIQRQLLIILAQPQRQVLDQQMRRITSMDVANETTSMLNSKNSGSDRGVRRINSPWLVGLKEAKKQQREIVFCVRSLLK